MLSNLYRNFFYDTIPFFSIFIGMLFLIFDIIFKDFKLHFIDIYIFFRYIKHNNLSIDTNWNFDFDKIKSIKFKLET